jgi:hypothetical protein
MRQYIATRPFPGQTVNGDAWLVMTPQRGARIAVIDGAGHGPQARQASELAMASLTESQERPLTEALTLCHQVLVGSRGAVISIVQFDGEQVEFAGVGNVEGRLFGGEKPAHLAPGRGLLGMALPTIRPQTFPLHETWAILLFTDGISQRSGLQLDPRHIEDPQTYVDEGLAAWGRVTDDATLTLILPA